MTDILQSIAIILLAIATALNAVTLGIHFNHHRRS